MFCNRFLQLAQFLNHSINKQTNPLLRRVRVVPGLTPLVALKLKTTYIQIIPTIEFVWNCIVTSAELGEKRANTNVAPVRLGMQISAQRTILSSDCISGPGSRNWTNILYRQHYPRMLPRTSSAQLHNSCSTSIDCKQNWLVPVARICEIG